MEKLKEIAELDRVYVDESGINKYLQREHARAKAGTPVYGATSGPRYARESFIAAKLQYTSFSYLDEALLDRENKRSE